MSGEFFFAFYENKTVANPFYGFVTLKVSNDSDGNPYQNISCGHWDGSFINYRVVKKNNIVEFFNEEYGIMIEGELSNDGNVLIVNLPNEYLYELNNDSPNILSSDGNTTIDYEGGAIITYVREE